MAGTPRFNDIYDILAHDSFTGSLKGSGIFLVQAGGEECFGRVCSQIPHVKGARV